MAGTHRGAQAARPDAQAGAPLTIAVLTWQRQDDVSRCIESVAKGAAAAEVPIVVLVNGSTDDTVAALRSAYPDIAVHEEASNLGCPGGRNRLTDLCETPWVFYLDDDGWVGPDFVDAALTAIASVPQDCAVIAGNVIDRHRDSDGDEDAGSNPPFRSGPTSSFSGGTCAIRRADFMRLGGYPDDDLRQGEETEFAMKVFDAGLSIYRSASLVLFHPRSHERAKRIELLRTGLRQSLLTGVRLCPWWMVPIWTVWKLAIYLRIAVELRALGTFGRAVGDALGYLPRTLRTRRPVRARAVLAASARLHRTRG